MTFELEHAIRRASEVIQKHTYPLLVDHGGVPDLIATCVFLQVLGNVFLVTAAHAIRRRHGRGLLTRGCGRLVVIDGRATVTKTDQSDPFDIAAIRIDPALVRDHYVSVICADMFATILDAANPHSRAICGYPVTKNKGGRALDRSNKVFNARFYTFFGLAKHEADFSRFRKSPELHIGLRYDAPGIDDAGQRLTTLPSPKGMSGGGAWLIPDFNQPEAVFLEWIFVECHANRHAFSTRLEHVLRFIQVSHDLH